MTVRTSGLFLLMLVASAGFAFGQGKGGGIAAGTPVQVEMQKELPPPAPPAWGTTAETAVILGAHSAIPHSDTVGWGTTLSGQTGFGISSTTGDNWFYQVSVPSGSIVTKIVIEGCDTSPFSQLVFTGVRGVAPAGETVFLAGAVGTGVAAMPGCGFFTLTVPGGPQIINATWNLWVMVRWEGVLDADVQLHSIRVYYKLQVSPAPGSATFADVPLDHPFHRFIEALAASGITGGCGGGNYCPDGPLTRGQMAVFLAVALGLHFPN